MSHELLQLWGGLFILLNRIFMWWSERTNDAQQKRKRRIHSWIAYLVGLPGFVAVFVIARNWIAASVQTGSGISMAFGLIVAIRGRDRTPVWLDYIARVAAVLGLGISIYDLGGFNTFTQVLELAITAGLLIGVYQLAIHKASGYLWFILLNLSSGTLMWIQGYYILSVQQIVCLLFAADAYRLRRKAELRTINRPSGQGGKKT